MGKRHRKKVTKYGALVTILLGLEKVQTADFTLSTQKMVSSALLLVLTKNLTLTLLQQLKKVQSSQTLLITLTTIQFGGKVSIRILQQMLLNGKVTLGMVRQAKKKVLIQTAVSQLLLQTAHALALNLKIQTVCRFQLLYSVADVQNSLHSFTNHVTGITVYS